MGLPSGFSFDLPWVLGLLVIVPALLAAYVWQLRRRRRAAVRFSDVGLVRIAVPRQRRWRRHVGIGLVLAGLAALGVAAARPQVSAEVPVSDAAVILALDVSGSMCATDVDPNRLTAAQDAVRTFIKSQYGNTRIGLVVFSGSAQVATAPTTDRDELLASVDGLTTGRGTTIGAAILKSIDAIAEIDSQVQPVGTAGESGEPAGAANPTKVPEIVVLLTDGANTNGVSPTDAADIAAERGVRVYPIGFGTTTPTQMVCTASQLGGRGADGPRGGGFGGQGRGGRGNFLIADVDTLQQVADTTGGEYFGASDADQLQSVLADLPRHVEVQRRDVEVSVGFSALGAVLVLLGLCAAVRWSSSP